jgi:O-antigen ligase
MAQVTRTPTASVVGRWVGLAAIILLQIYWFLEPAQFTFKALTAVIVGLSIARPSAGLLAFAGLAPLSTAIANLCGAYGMGARLIEQAALAVGAGALVWGGPANGRTRIGAPALFMAVVAVASAAAMVPADAAPVVRSLWDGLPHASALSSLDWTPLSASVVVAECGLLGWAVERTVRREPQLATRLVLIGLVGHAGASILDVQAVLSGALRSGNVIGALPRLLLGERISVQTDVHAAASALVLAGIAGFGLMNGSMARRVGVGLLLVLVGAGLWIGGSRVAIVLAVVAAIGTIGWSMVRAGGRRLMIAAVAVLVIGGGAWMATLYPGRYNTVSGSVDARLIMVKAGVQLFRQAPIFGIGITRFYGASAAYIEPEEARIVGYKRENAHNNFIQVAAEQGLVGLGAMVWWLAVMLVSGTRAQMAAPTPSRGALLAAIVACVGTWMTGHPLLVPEFAFVFWLYCGILTAMTPEAQISRPRWSLWVLVASVLVSIVPRAYDARNTVYLEHMGFGLSALWQHDDQQRYREAGAFFAIYLPASGRQVEVPIRRAPDVPDSLIVDVKIDGRLVDTVSLGSDAWQTMLIQMPARSRRFELVDFAVRSSAGSLSTPVLVRVGRDRER